MTETPYPSSQDQYQADLKALRSRDPRSIRKLLDTHFLKIFLGKAYDQVISKSVIKVLKRKAQEGEIDAVTLDRIVRQGLLHTEHIKRDKLSGLHIYDRGMLVEADHYLPGDAHEADQNQHIARTIYSIFHDPSARERAGQAQQFFHELAGYAREHADATWIRIALRHLKTMEPTYNQGNIVGNLFLGQAQDLHETLKDKDLDERVSHLRVVDRVELILGHYAQRFAETTQGKTLATASNGKQQELFKPVDHRRLLYEKVLLRADPTLQKRSDEEWKDLADLLVPETSLPQTVVHGDALPANMMVQGAGSRTFYTPIDFEFACVDYAEKMLVQRWAKSGIYDHLGRSLAREKESVEQDLIDKALHTYQSLGVAVDRTEFEHLIGKLKIENHLQWAARHKKYGDDLKEDLKASDDAIKKQEDLTHYFHTLAVLEIKRQGLISEDATASTDHRIAYLAGLFGETLSDAEMLSIHESLRPDQSGHSVMKEGYQDDVDRQLERVVAQAGRRERVGLVKKGAMILGIVSTVLGLGVHGHNLEHLRYLTEVDTWVRETYKQRAETLAWTLSYNSIHDEDIRKAEYREAILSPERAREMAERAGINYNLVWKVLNAVKWVSELGLKNEERDALRGYPLCDVYDGLAPHQTKPIQGKYDSRGERYLATSNYERCLQKLRTILEAHHIDPKDPFKGEQDTKEAPLQRALAEFFKPTGLEDDDLTRYNQSLGTSFPFLRWFGKKDWREEPADIVKHMIMSVVVKRMDSWQVADEYQNAWDGKVAVLEEKEARIREEQRQRRGRIPQQQTPPPHQAPPQYQRR